MSRPSASSKLQVYMNGSPVGLLERGVGGRLRFSYDGRWLSSRKAIPISLSLPLREEHYQDDRARAYFDNLLPDSGDVRRKIGETTGALDASVFELLRVIGRDCVGALQLIPDGAPPPRAIGLRGQPLSSEQISTILQGLSVYPQGPDAEPFRISLAGAQHKTALLKLNRRWALPQGATPTTHIFKPPIGKLASGVDLSSSVANEWLCLCLTKIFGLSVAKAEIERFDQTPCLVVERFDRRWSNRKTRLDRLAQEDLCQAAGIVSSRKYESHGGPGIVSLMQILDGSDARDEDRSTFIRAQLVYFLLGAIDGHAKNFSIHLTPTGFRLTPLYDVLTVWPALEDRQLSWKHLKFAMAVGDSRHYDLNAIQKRHWVETAKRSGFDLRLLEFILDDLQARVRTLRTSPPPLPKNFPGKLYEHTIKGIVKQAARLHG